jgi:hypothetical protein
MSINIVIPAQAGIYFLLLMIPLLALIACDNTGEPIIPEPAKVRMVEHHAADDTLAIERGIDAVPESDGIFLAWYSLNDPNITRYNIYRKNKDKESFYRHIKSINQENGIDTTFIDDKAEAGLGLDSLYSYFVTATNTDGVEGLAADSLDYLLIDKAELLKSDKETAYDPDVDGLPILSWRFVNVPNFYILRIENDFNQLHYVHIFQVTEFFNDQTLDLNDTDVVPDLPDFSPGIYKWRIDIIGPYEDYSGSESNWSVFIII